MDRARLENFTLEELRREALTYQLPVNRDRNSLIDTIMSHFEQNDPVMDDQLPVRTRNRLRNLRGGVLSDRDAPETTNDPPSAASQTLFLSIKHMAEFLRLCLEQQKLMMQQIQALSD
jgi:hypothetical protein